MSVERTIYCDRDGCEVHATTMHPAPYCPGGFLSVTWWELSEHTDYQFCGWDCVMKHAATYPPPTIIPFGPPDEDEP